MPGVGQQRPRTGMFAGKPAQPSQADGFWSRAFQQARAAVEGGLDAATFGVDDHVAAGIRAAGDWMHGKQIGAAYRQRIAEQHASDAYDKAHYGIARTVGTVGSLFIPGGAGSVRLLAKGVGKLPQAARLGEKAVAALGRWGAPAAKVAQRIPEVTRLGGKERVVIGAGGAVGGVGGQAAVDLAHGKLSSWRDYAGAAAGGMAQSMVALKGNPKLAAAVGGATSSVTDDVLRGKMPSIDEAAKSAYASMLPASIANKAVTRVFDRLPNTTKQKVGELGSKIRTRINGDRTISTAQTAENRIPLNVKNQIGKRVKRPYTQPDQLTAKDKVIESKFGYSADLSDRQKQAYRELGSRYRVDHFLPDDVGSLAGFVVSQPAHSAKHQKVWDVDPSVVSRVLQSYPDPTALAQVYPGYSW